MKSLSPLLLLVTASLLAAFAPPAGRPPSGPLERVKPRLYDVTYGVTVQTFLPNDAGYRENMDLEMTPIVMPVIFQDTFSKVDHESMRGRLWLEAREDTSLPQRTRIDDGYPHNTHMAVMSIVKFQGQAVRWELGYRVKVWSSKIDDEAAAQIAWPRQWPKEVQDGLQPQMFIESDLPIFKDAVEQVSGGQLRLVPPYLAAKDLVRYCLNQVQKSGDGHDMRAARLIHGMEVKGAMQTARTNVGNMHDIVCLCVAMLRAAGIPARPVIGMYKKERAKTRYVTWAEFYLPEVGWIPFDPVEMMGKGIRHKNVREPWPEFGTMKDLNERIPLAFHFLPPAAVESPQSPALWGWDPKPQRPETAEQIIHMQMISRGAAPEDGGGGGGR